jgi:hypothetical protein
MINVHVCTSPIANGVFGNAEAALPIANGLAGSTGQPLPIANGRFNRDPSNRKRAFNRPLPIANGPLIGPFQS